MTESNPHDMAAQQEAAKEYQPVHEVSFHLFCDNFFYLADAFLYFDRVLPLDQRPPLTPLQMNTPKLILSMSKRRLYVGSFAMEAFQ